MAGPPLGARWSAAGPDQRVGPLVPIRSPQGILCSHLRGVNDLTGYLVRLEHGADGREGGPGFTGGIRWAGL